MDFKIFTDKLTYVKNDEQAKESFTFYIERNNYSPANNTIENLILTKRFNEDQYKAYIIIYFFPDGIASEHKNFKVTGFKAVNSETFSFNNLTSKSACENTYEYTVIETAHKCYSGAHSGSSEAANCEGKGSLPYSTYQIVAYQIASCGESMGGGGMGGDQSGTGGGSSSTPGSGGSGPVDTGISLPPSCQSVDCEVPILANDINVLLGNTLNFEQLTFLFNNDNIANEVKNYLDQNTNAAAKKFGIWAINYFINNPSVTFEQFKNQFMGSSEGNDGTYDPVFWENPNLTFPKQNLPKWSDFSSNFPYDSDPKYDTPQKMYNSIGGDVASLYSGPKTNTCAIRLSKALNYSGVIIPNLPGKTFKGADNKFYFKAAYEINLWMRATFGTNPASTINPKTPYNPNHSQYSEADAGTNGVNLPRLLLGKKGIYSIYSSNFNWATGHADLLKSDATCGNECHFYDAPIYRLDIWILN
ncbi:hypothetical protein GJU43_00605 [Flavobacterium sp. LC2016-23]|uniref:T6SS effector amidase Tae4 family protein n=1 Tax=Flavobacterium sp. LC2016-23 TaxID=2666330 RepID=UPI0012B05A37|nr:T6SS effector amidase Tae4 family protein [Flavobacterium sp. LC2016-23]MRX37762.1 hypothetical protein [Flavobacterium sp. LC2016-23]